MKRIVKYLLVLSLSILFMLSGKASFYAAGVALVGPSTVRAGDTITLNLNVSDVGKFGLEGTLNYDSSVVSLSNMSCNIS